MTQVINWTGDSGDGVYIGGGDPKDTNHTPLRAMSFTNIGQFAVQTHQRVLKQSPNLLKGFLRPENPLAFTYLKQFHSGNYRLRRNQEVFEHVNVFYNESGNEVKFMNVYVDHNFDFIGMRMRTHDAIVMEGNRGGVVNAGWGNDFILGVEDSYMMGLSGSDTIIANGGWSSARGGSDNDTLISNARGNGLMGEQGDDTLIANSRSVLAGGRGRDTYIVNVDQSPESGNVLVELHDDDRLVINFKGNHASFGGVVVERRSLGILYQIFAEHGIGRSDVHLGDENHSYVKDSAGNTAVSFSGELDNFDIRVSDEGSTVTITGENF